MCEISNNNQITTFLLSICMGIIFCLSYDIIRAFRKIALNSIVAINICDILYWIIYAFATFVFFVARTNGEIRGFVLFGELLGFISFRVSLSRFIVRFLSFIFIKISTLKQKIDRHFYSSVAKVEKHILKIVKYASKSFKSIKKFLKNIVRLLYNKLNIVDAKRSLDETKTET